jgi:Na+-driven multidrug efflux pump
MICFEKAYYVMAIQLCSTVLHCVWNYIFVLQLDMGVKGTACCNSLTYLLNFTLSSLCLFCMKDLRETQFWPDRSFFTWSSFKSYFDLAGPTTILQCSESGAFQIILLESNIISVLATAAIVPTALIDYVMSGMCLGLT